MRSFRNPIIENSTKNNTSDPYIVFHNGAYYHCYGNKNGVYVAKSKKLEDIGKAKAKKVYAYFQDGRKDNDWYAPELHWINNAWYIYGSPDVGNGCHSMSVLENKNPDPTSPFAYKGVVRGLENQWTLDGTVFNYKNKDYFIWSKGKELLIARLVSPWEIENKGVVIGKLEYEFEKRNGEVMEGPAVLKTKDKLFLIYSVNDSKTDDYALGIMTLKGENPLQKEGWEKYPTAVFEKTGEVFGPGHCCFTKVMDEGGLKDYIVYHANLESGSGWNGRSVWAQEITYNEDGFPVFGKPIR